MQNNSDLGSILEAGQVAEAVGQWDEALSIYENALQSFGSAGGGPAADFLRKIGLVHYYRGNFEEALARFDTSKKTAVDAGLTSHIAAADNCLAIVHQTLGQLDVAETLYNSARVLALQAGNDKLAVMIDQNLGTIASIRGDTAQALERYQMALHRYQAMGDNVGAARALNNIAMLHTDLRDWDSAEATFDEALNVAEAAHDAETLGTVQLNRAEYYVRRERYDDARACCDQAFEIFGRLGSTSGLGETYKVYGTLYRQSGKLHLAEAHLALVAELAGEADHALLEAEAEQERALVHLEQGRKSEALKSLNRAHHIFTDLKARRQLVDIDHELDSLEKSYLSIVQVWAESIESRDHYTAGHCARVAEYTTKLAKAVGFHGRELTWIRMGAFLHDVGKTRLPATLLNKPTDLTSEEWQIMRGHTIAGDEIVAELDLPYDLRPMVRSHHERWDGAGYPDGLAGSEIPLVARILCLADVFDAMTTDRSYRAAYSCTEALRLMAAEAGRMLDPELFDVFQALMKDSNQTVAAARPRGYDAFLNRPHQR